MLSTRSGALGFDRQRVARRSLPGILWLGGGWLTGREEASENQPHPCLPAQAGKTRPGTRRNKKKATSKAPHAKPAYGAPKFVSGFVVRAIRPAERPLRRTFVRLEKCEGGEINSPLQKMGRDSSLRDPAHENRA